MPTAESPLLFVSLQSGVTHSDGSLADVAVMGVGEEGSIVSRLRIDENWWDCVRRDVLTKVEVANAYEVFTVEPRYCVQIRQPQGASVETWDERGAEAKPLSGF